MVEYKGHLKMGYVTPTHKGQKISTSLNSIDFESFIQRMDTLDYEVGFIPPGYAHRADLISDLFYNTPTYDWLILYFNNIEDPFQSLNVGQRILIPKF